MPASETRCFYGLGFRVYGVVFFVRLNMGIMMMGFIRVVRASSRDVVELLRKP